jgi:hypothetical protein
VLLGLVAMFYLKNFKNKKPQKIEKNSGIFKKLFACT